MLLLNCLLLLVIKVVGDRKQGWLFNKCAALIIASVFHRFYEHLGYK